jgi:hypothetical protein
MTLTVYAFDDTVRAVAGEVAVEAPRWSIREGRVALVANGPAVFSALSVDSLDLYRFDFVTSRYRSFTEHIQSWDGKLIELAESAAGAIPTPLAALLLADRAAVTASMVEAADPQARQALFAKWITALGLPLREQPAGLLLSRWTGADGTLALVLESPEPVPFTRDVTVSLVHHLPPTKWQPIGTPQLQAALLRLVFSATSVTCPEAFAIFVPGDLIVVVTQSSAGTTFSIYGAPQRGPLMPIPGKFQQTISPKKGVNPVLDAMRDFPDATLALVRGKALLAAVNHKVATGPVDVAVPLVVLDNGEETAALLSPTTASGMLTPLPPGKYTLQFGLSRQRWRDTSSTNPESVYVQEQSLEVDW